MKVVIVEKTYNKLTNLSFDPETDVAGSELVINQLSVDILTQDDIAAAEDIYLYDDVDKLWAKYWIIEAVRIDAYSIRVFAQSHLVKLDRFTMPPIMYSDITAANAMAAIFASLGASSYSLDESLADKTISGYCPEQTARERLQWICLVIGAYVKSYFTDKIEILVLDETISQIPIQKTFWKPSRTYGDYVTAVKIRSYSYVVGSPQNTDTWVEVNGTYYIQTTQDIMLQNPDVPSTMTENIIAIDGVMLINQSNASAILSHLSAYYFKRMEVDADIINNGEYLPGDQIYVYDDVNSMAHGIIKSATFTFGLQARSRIHVMQSDDVESGTLIIYQRHSGSVLSRLTYSFPIGYNYVIENPYLDQTRGLQRRIYRPLVENATGIIASETVEDYEDYEVALSLYVGELTIYSVDEVSESGGKVRIK